MRRLWGFGLLAECLVIFLLFFASNREVSAPTPTHPDRVFNLFGPPNDPRRQEVYQYLRDSLGIQITIAGDTLTTFTKDSLSLAVLARGDTVRNLDLSPAAERKVAGVVAPVVRAFVEAGRAILMFVVLILAITLLPIPLALGTVTFLWWRAQRGRTSATDA